MHTETLMNILLEPLELAAESPELFYRSGKPLERCEDGYRLAADTDYDFCTYFNMLSLAKWKQYTEVTKYALHLDIDGSFALTLFAFAPDGTSTEILQKNFIAQTGAVDIDIPQTDACLVGMAMHAKGECLLKCATFTGDTQGITTNDVRLAVGMTTFNNERYILPNITLFASLFEGTDELAGNLAVNIVDNGRSLDPEIIPESAREHIRIFPNDNAGGAGGFCRGMMESLASDFDPTHVLLMDDDVSISPESFRRTFMLLKLRKKEYRDACINGAMLRLEKPFFQTEDVAYVRFPGVYGSIKRGFDLTSVSEIAESESTNVEVKNAYGAWWYCCIPASLISKKGLPLPVFVRCDDVEYGVRLQTRYMTLAGICVWHAGFEGRFKGSVDHYQYVRNFMIMNSIHHACPHHLFMLRTRQTFWREISSLCYGNAELILDALEDYLAGPEFLMRADGAAIMKKNASKNERFVPREEAEKELNLQLSALLHPRSVAINNDLPPYGNKLTRITMAWDFDPHKLRDSQLEDTPVVLSYNNLSVLDKQTQRARVVVAYNPEDDTASIRRMDRARYDAIMKRKNAIAKRLKKEGASVRKAWCDAFPYLTSQPFWRGYLHLD